MVGESDIYIYNDVVNLVCLFVKSVQESNIKSKNGIKMLLLSGLTVYTGYSESGRVIWFSCHTVNLFISGSSWVFHLVSAALSSSAEELLSNTNTDNKSKMCRGRSRETFGCDCGPAGENVANEKQLLCLKEDAAEVLLSKAASSSSSSLSPVEFSDETGPWRPPGVNKRKRMNINEDADEKRGKRAHWAFSG